MKSNLVLRTVTGVCFVAVLVGAILYSPLTFGVLFAIITALTVFEFGTLINNSGQAEINRILSSLGGAYLYLAVMSFCCDAMDARVFIPYLLIFLALMIRELYLKKPNPIANWAYTMLSQMYIALPFAMLNVLAFYRDPVMQAVTYNPILPLSVFVFIWLNDTGAYCVGSLIGKRRLFERISPKKSWEGSIGGGLFAIASAFVFTHFFGILSMAQWIGLALTVVVFGTWGDLVESLLKRTLKIKDSGNILPGHGGLLDRFDSAILAVPAAALFLYIVTM